MRRASLVTGCLMLLAASAGQARAPQPAAALEVMGNPYNQATYRRLAAAFVRESPGTDLKVTFSPREGDEIVRALLLRAFTGAALPDVAFLNGDVIRTFAERGLLTPLDRWVQGSRTPALRTMKIGQSAYGVPFGLSVPLVAFNSELLKRAGADPQALPRSWPGVLALARRIESTIPEATGGFIEHDNGGAFTFLYLLESYGVAPMSADERQLSFESALGLQALSVLKGFGEAGQADSDMSRRQARRAFASGRIGVLVTMSSVIPYLEKTSAGRFEVLVTPLPIADAHARVPAAGPVAVMFAKDPQRQRRAWRFIEYAIGPQGQAILAATSGYLPAADRSDARVDPTRVTSWFTFPGRNSLKISQLIQDQMQQVATLQKTPEGALTDIAHSVQPLLARRR